MSEKPKLPNVARQLFHALDDLCDYAESFGWEALESDDGQVYRDAAQRALRAAAPVLGIGNAAEVTS